ncbi:hypothetical protein BDW42DRAFT_196997 [Aspergillus taichungensis]|uniref:Uncharacterized protein n=1 Tax=Aspergillus taichungensis TaxID=482145 RepID=A0A2J5HI87_9EURO|nr:hypothetical protein BDW42DRAFT_196997 [Aspergillus taichungensis]
MVNSKFVLSLALASMAMATAGDASASSETDCYNEWKECWYNKSNKGPACDAAYDYCSEHSTGMSAVRRDDGDAATKCEKALNECRTKPGAIQAVCTAEHKDCLKDDGDNI